MKKQVSPLLEEMKFLFLRDFVNWIDEGIAREWGELEKRRENGEFEEYEDYEAARDYPLFHAKYAAESILQLLNILVDEQLRNLVESSTECSFDPRKPALPSEKISNMRLPDIQKKIEDSYKISLADIEGWDRYLKIRDIANTLKHASGQRRLKKVIEEGGSLNDLYHNPTLESVKESVDVCVHLVRSLYGIAYRGGQDA